MDIYCNFNCQFVYHTRMSGQVDFSLAIASSRSWIAFADSSTGFRSCSTTSPVETDVWLCWKLNQLLMLPFYSQLCAIDT